LTVENTPASPWDVKPASVAVGEQNGYSWRYAVVTLVFLLWAAFLSAVDEFNGSWFTVRLLTNIPALCILIYLLAALVSSILKAHFAKSISVIFGPPVTLLIFSIVINVLDNAGLTAERARFLWEQEKLLAQILSEKGEGQNVRSWFWKTEGIAFAPHSETILLYDPSGQVLLLPNQRSEEWVQSMRKLGNNDRYILSPRDVDEYKEYVSIKKMSGDFYLVTQYFGG